MEINLPKTSLVFSALLRADLTTLWRNRRSFIMVLVVPVLILISWKGLVDKLGGPFVLATCTTLGLVSIGLMGYTNSIARDRDKGIFQRLRVSPVPSWCIMASRLTVQLMMILLMTTLVFIVGYKVDHIVIPVAGYVLTYLMVIVGGSLYLSLGQAIVGSIKNPESVNSTTRLIYFAFIMIGTVGELGVLGDKVTQAVHWSPYGTVKAIVNASLQPGTWGLQTTYCLLATLGYIAVLATLGIKWFKWNTK